MKMGDCEGKEGGGEGDDNIFLVSRPLSLLLLIGYSVLQMGIGNLSEVKTVRELDGIVSSLTRSSSSSFGHHNDYSLFQNFGGGGGCDVETRINLTKSLGEIAVSTSHLLTKFEFGLVVSSLISSSFDYTREERRGDMGSLVRRESVVGLELVVRWWGGMRNKRCEPPSSSSSSSARDLLSIPPTFYSNYHQHLGDSNEREVTEINHSIIARNQPFIAQTPLGRGWIIPRKVLPIDRMKSERNGGQDEDEESDGCEEKEDGGGDGCCWLYHFVRIDGSIEDELGMSGDNKVGDGGVVIPLHFITPLSSHAEDDPTIHDINDEMIVPDHEERARYLIPDIENHISTTLSSPSSSSLSSPSSSSAHHEGGDGQDEVDYLSEYWIRDIICALLRMWSEGRDDVREISGRCLCNLILPSPPQSASPSSSSFHRVPFVEMREGVEIALKKAQNAIKICDDNDNDGGGEEEISRSQGGTLGEIEVALPSLLLLSLLPPYSLSILVGIIRW